MQHTLQAVCPRVDMISGWRVQHLDRIDRAGKVLDDDVNFRHAFST